LCADLPFQIDLYQFVAGREQIEDGLGDDLLPETMPC
jgi:hypothetical protein